MEKPKFEFYERPNGHNEFLEFLEKLPQKNTEDTQKRDFACALVIYKDFEAENLRLESAVVLLKAREDAGLTQRELARRVDVPQSTIARIERGNNTSVDTLSKIANALGKKLCLLICN